MANQKAWTRQRELQKKYSYDEVPTTQELVNKLNEVIFGKKDPIFQSSQAKALFAIYYLTACRKSEILFTPRLRKSKKRIDVTYDEYGAKIKTYERDDDGNEIIDEWIENHTYVGIKKHDIVFSEVDGKPVMHIRTENRKHKNRKTKRQPIPIEFEDNMAKFVKDYLELIGSDDSILFEFSDKRASQIINEIIGFNVHFIRHIRLTHLITKYDFNEQALIMFAGWTDNRPAKHYMELSNADIFRQFYKR